jgi:hypothetical protein
LRANPPESERAKAQANIERCEQDIREREAAASADQIKIPIMDVPPPPPPPQEEKIVYVPPPPLKKTYVFGHILLGVGIVGLGGGAYLFYTGRKTLDDHNNAPTYDDYVSTLPDIDVAKRNQKIGVIAAASGGALIGGAILFYVLHSRSRGETPPPPVNAAVTSEGATLTFTGTF